MLLSGKKYCPQDVSPVTQLVVTPMARAVEADWLYKPCVTQYRLTVRQQVVKIVLSIQYDIQNNLAICIVGII